MNIAFNTVICAIFTLLSAIDGNIHCTKNATNTPCKYAITVNVGATECGMVVKPGAKLSAAPGACSRYTMVVTPMTKLKGPLKGAKLSLWLTDKLLVNLGNDFQVKARMLAEVDTVIHPNGVFKEMKNLVVTNTCEKGEKDKVASLFCGKKNLIIFAVAMDVNGDVVARSRPVLRGVTMDCKGATIQPCPGKDPSVAMCWRPSTFFITVTTTIIIITSW